jgi:kynurenine formamidase
MQPDRLQEQFASKTAPATEAQPDNGQTSGVSRRGFIQGGVVAGMTASLTASALVAHHDTAQAQPAGPQAANPFGKAWWPSPWGPADERGAANRITPAKVLEAVKLIKTGKLYQLGRLYEQGMPLFGARHYSLTIPGGPTGATLGPVGTNQLVGNDEMVSGEIGQVGTQFDGLGHIATLIGNEPVYYNGFKQSEVGGAYGLQRLGIHNVGVFFTRGVLIDVLTYKGGDRLPIGYIVTPADVQGALARQGTREPGEGDVVLFRTGHGQLWMKDNVEYNKGCPGPSVTTAKWLIEKQICLVGADTWAVEAVPGEEKDRAFEAHQWLLTMNGIYIHENLDVEQLAADRVYEFAYIFSPLRLKGATGSPGNPIAVV